MQPSRFQKPGRFFVDAKRALCYDDADSASRWGARDSQHLHLRNRRCKCPAHSRRITNPPFSSSKINFYSVDRAVASALALSRYDGVVCALGGYGEYVESRRDLRPALERALASDKPACANVRIDAGANAAVSANSVLV